MVDAVPWPNNNPGAAHASYGMLARDGITCTACHRMVLGEKAAVAAGRRAIRPSTSSRRTTHGEEALNDESSVTGKTRQKRPAGTPT